MAGANPPRLKKARLLAYRLLDVGDEIQLDRVGERLGGAEGRRARLSREGAESLAFAAPPLHVPLGRREVLLPGAGRTLETDVSARFFDYGAVSVLFEFPLDPGVTFDEILPLCNEIYDTPVLETHARREIDVVRGKLGDAVRGPHDWPGVETYTVVFAEEMDGHPPSAAVLEGEALARLLLGETGGRPLSAEEREDVVKHAYRYLDDDLAVIDWNSAFVLEPSGSRDIPDLLEFATSQLLELRYYDHQLDAELNRVYDEFGAVRRPWGIVRSPYGDLALGVLRRLLELTEFTERVENSLKVIGDFYLARVYQAAVRRFRIAGWQTSIYRKLGLLAQVYDLLKGATDIRRTTLLEVTIVVLIVFEIVFALVR